LHIIQATPAPTNGGSPSVTKIGSTWAGATGLIDLDNLAAKNTPTKQGPTLNQMQMSKHSLGVVLIHGILVILFFKYSEQIFL
ncbi:hypothetical protein OESDEN_01405, partial [Oesophagostomum dentatum]